MALAQNAFWIHRLGHCELCLTDIQTEGSFKPLHILLVPQLGPEVAKHMTKPPPTG